MLSQITKENLLKIQRTQFEIDKEIKGNFVLTE